MNIIKINGKVIPGTIAGYKGTMIDVDGDGTGTTENGVTIRDIRRRGKSKITLKLDGLTQEAFTEIMTELNSDRIEVEFFCGYYRTMTAYAGDKNWEIIKATNEHNGLWKLEVNLIEY